MKPDLPVDWEYEPADPGVGFLSESFCHCGDDPAVEKMFGGTFPYRGQQYVTFRRLLTCPTCHATTIVEQEEYVGDAYEPIDYERLD